MGGGEREKEEEEEKEEKEKEKGEEILGELVYVIMVTEKSHSRPSVNWRTRETSSVAQPTSKSGHDRGRVV
jgi:hypothetical protein